MRHLKLWTFPLKLSLISNAYPSLLSLSKGHEVGKTVSESHFGQLLTPWLWTSHFTPSIPCPHQENDNNKRKSPPKWVGQEKERERNKKRERERNWDRKCTPGRHLWKRECFCTLGSPLRGRDRGRPLGPGRRLQHWLMEDKVRTGCIGGQCHQALPSLRCLPARAS